MSRQNSSILLVDEPQILETLKKLLENEATKKGLQEAHAAKLISLGEMAVGMAHEINNPLAIIRMSMRVISKKVEQESMDLLTINSKIESIDSMVERITAIIKSLRNLSRSDMDSDRKSFNLLTLFKDILSLSGTKYRLANIEIDQDLDDPLYLENVNGNLVSLGQVFINLLNNSFEPFFTSKEIGKGTGVGMSISRTIIEKHNGKFYLYRESEQTRFVIKLPLLSHFELSNK